MMYCLILEDEQPAQEILHSYIHKIPFLQCIGTYENGMEITIDKLQKAHILFLDIQLPELNGLSFLKTIDNPPNVIVTSAYSEYAIQAFEEAVTDYLLKPFSFERFFKAVNRVRNNLIGKERDGNRNLFLYADKTLFNVIIDDILIIKAEIDYVKIITKEKDYLILGSLRNWKENLMNFPFIQVHRSYIVNIDKIIKIQGNQIFIGSELIPIGKKYKELLMERIK